MSRVRRALLYMPGNELRKIQKAATFDVDAICMDLEDGVAFDSKATARATVAEALQTVDFGRSERLVRINAAGSGLEHDDLAETVHAHPDGYVLPKVESTEQIEWLCWRLTEAEQTHGWEVGSLRVLVNIETAKGVLNLREIVECDQRLDALLFGAEDLAVNIGATRTREAMEVFYARSAVVLHAAAFGLQALDMVFFDFTPQQGLRHEALEGARMGFVGKQIIHPNQIAPVQEMFTPSAQEVAQAQRVVEAYAEHEAQGAGSFALDGRLVDMPVVRLARQVLERAKLAGKS